MGSCNVATEWEKAITTVERDLARLDVVLAFAFDIDSPPARAREAAALIPGARFAEVADASHLGIFTHADAVGKILADFFANV